MKPKIRIELFIAFVITAGVLWLGCAKIKQNSKNIPCKPAYPPENKQITVNDQSFTTKIYKTPSRKNLVLSKIQNETLETSDMMQKIIASIDKYKVYEKLLNEGYIPVNYNLYVTRDIRLDSMLIDSEIAALGSIMFKDEGLHHFIFLKNGQGDLVIDKKYSVETAGLYLNDYYLVFDKLVYVPDSNNIYSLITTVTPHLNEVRKIVKSKNILRNVLLNKH